VAAEGTLVDLAVVGAVEGHAVVLELDDDLVGLAAHELDGVLVAEPVGPLDGVVHVPVPVVLLELPSEAATPPCAATVCERVGNTLVSTAVLRPASESCIAARRPAPPAPTMTASKAVARCAIQSFRP
jgi:hypothetical protein